jgi:hypothetical protein
MTESAHPMPDDDVLALAQWRLLRLWRLREFNRSFSEVSLALEYLYPYSTTGAADLADLVEQRLRVVFETPIEEHRAGAHDGAPARVVVRMDKYRKRRRP